MSPQDLRHDGYSRSDCPSPLTPTCLPAAEPRYADGSTDGGPCTDPCLPQLPPSAVARVAPRQPPPQVVTQVVIHHHPDGGTGPEPAPPPRGGGGTGPPSPGGWRAVMAVQQPPRPPLPSGAIRVVHPSGVSIVMLPKWESATVRDARVQAAAEWCVPAQTLRLHCPNTSQRPNPSCRGTALDDDLPLAKCASPGDELFAVPLAAAQHLRDPTVNKNGWRQKPLPDRLQCAGTMLPSLAENPRDCSTLQRELDAARELGRADWCDGVLHAVAQHCGTLLTHPCGNYLLRHCLECWPQRFLTPTLAAVRGRAVPLSCDRHASYVLQACLVAASASAAVGLFEELLHNAERLCADASGNYVLQTAIDECPSCLLKQLERRVAPVVSGCPHAPKMRRKLELRLRTKRRASERERGQGREQRRKSGGMADQFDSGLSLSLGMGAGPPLRPASVTCWADDPIVD